MLVARHKQQRSENKENLEWRRSSILESFQLPFYVHHHCKNGVFGGTEKVPHSQKAHAGEFKTQSAEFQTRNSTAKREWQFSETESR